MNMCRLFTLCSLIIISTICFSTIPIQQVQLASPQITNSVLGAGMVYKINKGPSPVQSMTVSGTSLTNSLIINSPIDFEISLDGTNFQSTPINLTSVNGNVSSTLIYVRLKAGLPVNVYNEQMTLTTVGATTVLVTCSGAVNPEILSVGGDGTYCSGASIKLTCDAVGATQYFWTGPNGFTSAERNPTILNAKSTMSGVYTVVASTSTDNNLVKNADFEQGNTGFTSTYKYTSTATDWSQTILNPRNYTVTNDPGHPWGYDLSTWFKSCGDHTSGTGKMLCVNAASETDVEIWGTDVTVQPNMNYSLSYWVASFYNYNNIPDPNPSILQLKLNGQKIGNPYTVNNQACNWQQFQYLATSTTPNLHISLVNMRSGDPGNDFAIDDISFKINLFETKTVNVSVGSISAPTVGTITRPDCNTPTGSVLLNNLPAGNWTLKRTPGNIVSTGTGTSTTVTGLAPGTYQYTVTDPNGGCTSSAVSVTIPAKLNPNIVLSNSALTVFTYKVTKGPSSTPSFNVSGTELVGDVVVAPPTNYEISLSSTSGFQSTPLSLTPSGNTLKNTTIYVRLKAGLNVDTYKNNGISITSTCATTQNVSCSPGEVSPLIQTINTGGPYCSGSTINLTCTAIGATSYKWTGPNGFTSILQNPTITNATSNMSGTYTVTATAMSSDGLTPLTDSKSVNLTVSSVVNAPQIDRITHPKCGVPTGIVDINRLPAGDWTLSASPADINPVKGKGSTTTVIGLKHNTDYTFTVIDESTGCSSAPSVVAHINDTLVVPVQPEIGNVTQPTCGFDFASVTVNKLPKGTWRLTCSPADVVIPDGSGSSTTIIGLKAGKTYTFSVEDASSGCVSIPSLPALIQPSLNVPVIKIDSVIKPSCGVKTGGVAFNGLPASWKIKPTPADVPERTGNSSTFIFDGLKPKGTYTFVVTDLNSGCESAPSVSITISDTLRIPPPPKVKVTTIPTCESATGSVLVYGLPSNGNWTLKQVMNGTSAADQGIIISGSGESIPIPKLAGGAYQFYVIDEVSGCPSLPSDSSVIVIPPQPVTNVPSITIDQPTCAVATGKLTFSGLPSVAWTMNGSDGKVYKGNTTGFEIKDVIPGDYSFIVTNDITTCVSLRSGVQTVLPQPITPAAPGVVNVVKPTCKKPYSTIAFNNMPSSMSWKLTATPLFGDNVLTLQGSGLKTELTGFEPSNTYSIAVNNGSCNSEIITVSIDAMPSMPSVPLIDSLIQPTCGMYTGGVKVSGLPAGNWVLTDNQSKLQAKGSGNSFEFENLLIGTHRLTVIDSLGCESALTHSFELIPYPINTITLISKAGTDNSQYLERNQPLQPIIYHTSGATNAIVSNLPLGINYRFVNDSVIIYGSSDVFGKYNYSVLLTGGCGNISTTGYFTILPSDVKVPNAFSPNGDGENDYFIVKHDVEIQKLAIKIYDRSGYLHFKDDNFNGSWDGRSNMGVVSDLMSGTYYYVLEVFNGVYTKQHAGYISLHR